MVPVSVDCDKIPATTQQKTPEPVFRFERSCLCFTNWFVCWRWCYSMVGDWKIYFLEDTITTIRRKHTYITPIHSLHPERKFKCISIASTVVRWQIFTSERLRLVFLSFVFTPRVCVCLIHAEKTRCRLAWTMNVQRKTCVCLKQNNNSTRAKKSSCWVHVYNVPFNAIVAFMQCITRHFKTVEGKSNWIKSKAGTYKTRWIGKTIWCSTVCTCHNRSSAIQSAVHWCTSVIIIV